MTHLSPNQKRGAWGERWVYDRLKHFKYEVRYAPDFAEPCKDLVLENTCVEVKTAYQTTRSRTRKSGAVSTYPKWSWDTGKIGPRNEGILFLLAVDTHGTVYPFILPISLMYGRATFEINSHPLRYRGFIAPFLDCWDTIPFMTGRQYHDPAQMELFQASLTGEISYSEAVQNA